MKAGDTILIHAAAGGVGLIVCQWAKALGATVIGTVGSDEKAELARAHGCDHPIVYTRQDFVAEVERITGGAKLPVVYDSRRQRHLPEVARLPARARHDGQLRQCVGAARSVPAGPARAEGLAVPHPANALRLHRDARASSSKRRASCSTWSTSGKVKIEVKQRFPLEDAAEAHRALEARKTSGSTVLTI